MIGLILDNKANNCHKIKLYTHKLYFLLGNKLYEKIIK